MNALEIPSESYRLARLELYNWGTFADRHSATFDPQGCAVIGPTGSGKTTLIDGLMTLLVAQPKYNLASTGGHESDRDLISYLRGVSGAGSADGDSNHISRSGKTRSALGAIFSFQEKHVQVAAILWTDGSGFAATDRKDIWLFSEDENQDLDYWLAVHRDGGIKALKRLARENEKLQVFDTKRSYLAYLRKFFEVNDKAFTLLNRAAGLKQLNSIDEIFRELVLDDQSAFRRAQEVAQEFDDLAAIRNELTIARRQAASLGPLLVLTEKHQAVLKDLTRYQQLQHDLPFWFARKGASLWQREIDTTAHNMEILSVQAAEHEAELKILTVRIEHLRDLYKSLGGHKIELLEVKIGEAKFLLANVAQAAADYQKLSSSINLPNEITAENFANNRAEMSARKVSVSRRLEVLDEHRIELSSLIRERQIEKTELTAEISEIKSRPGSNLPAEYQNFRESLAEHLAVDASELPFVAELVEVKAEQKYWRGAIERALGGHRMRLLVPSEQSQVAISWINHRDNKLHIRLLAAEAKTAHAHFMKDGFTTKLNFKSHPLREALKPFLAAIDRHCVSDVESLRSTSHAMTQQGMMSGSKGQFEKQDQRALGRGWMTGFDNRDRLQGLNESLGVCDSKLDALVLERKTCIAEVNQAQLMLGLLDAALGLKFDDINLVGVERQLNELNNQLAELKAPNSELSKAKDEHDKTALDCRELEAKKLGLEKNHAVAEDKLKQMYRQLEACQARMGEPLTVERNAEVEKYLKGQSSIDVENLNDLERSQSEALRPQLAKLGKTKSDTETAMVRQMGRAKQDDTGYLAEVGTDVRDLEFYLERFRVLSEEALPEKLSRFLQYLNQSSDQGVTQMLADIENEVAIIEERIDDLNQTLYKVDFQPGRYLQIMPNKVSHEELRKLEAAQRSLRSAALQDDQGESQYKALSHLVDILRDNAERRRTIGAKALLDPRYRIQFSIDVLGRDDHVLVERRTGSQGGSGGEKEIIASYILTASLSYALCPDGSDKPLFSTIVLDEAFSKSSMVVAGRIVAALREFGLHPIFITPNKEIRLLKRHTRSAILVHKKGVRSSLATMSWEKLEAHFESRKSALLQQSETA